MLVAWLKTYSLCISSLFIRAQKLDGPSCRVVSVGGRPLREDPAEVMLDKIQTVDLTIGLLGRHYISHQLNGA